MVVALTLSALPMTSSCCSVHFYAEGVRKHHLYIHRMALHVPPPTNLGIPFQGRGWGIAANRRHAKTCSNHIRPMTELYRNIPLLPA